LRGGIQGGVSSTNQNNIFLPSFKTPIHIPTKHYINFCNNDVRERLDWLIKYIDERVDKDGSYNNTPPNPL
jgi:hypothetical protein